MTNVSSGSRGFISTELVKKMIKGEMTEWPDDVKKALQHLEDRLFQGKQFVDYFGLAFNLGELYDSVADVNRFMRVVVRLHDMFFTLAGLFKPDAKVLRTIQEAERQPVHVMDDETFRVYFPDKSPKDPDQKHFTVGLVGSKTDQEILEEAAYLLTGSGVQLFHEDGTPHI